VRLSANSRNNIVPQREGGLGAKMNHLGGRTWNFTIQDPLSQHLSRTDLETGITFSQESR